MAAAGEKEHNRKDVGALDQTYKEIAKGALEKH